MTETDKAYIAGILDGEGSIGIYVAKGGDGYGSHVLQVTVKMSEPAAVEMISAVCNVPIHVGKVRNNSRPCGTIIIRAGKALELLTQCLPYMRVKKVQAEIGIAFQTAKANCLTRNRKGAVRGRERLSREEWDLREAFRVRMYAANSGRLGFVPKPLRAAATTEWEGRPRGSGRKRQSGLRGNTERAAEMTAPTTLEEGRE